MSLSCYTGYDSPDFYVEKELKARKQHTCCECRLPINPGDDYVRITGCWEGQVSAYKTCEKCYGLETSLWALGFCSHFEDLFEAYKQYLDEYTKAVQYDEDTDEYIYPENHLMTRNGERRRH